MVVRVAAMMTLWASASAAWALPDDDGWVSLLKDGVPLGDVADDAVGGLDLVGSADAPAVLWHADREVVSFRLRVAAPPSPGPGFSRDTWGVVVERDGSGTPISMLGVTTSSRQVFLYRGAVDATSLADVGIWQPVVPGGFARVVADGEGAFIDFDVSRSMLFSELTIGAARRIRFAAVTFEGTMPGQPIDVAACDGAVDCSPLVPVLSDEVQLDADRDGLTLPVELRLGSDPTLEDSDGGGLADGLEDRDGDGIIERWETDPTNPDDDADADGDTLPDIVERNDAGLRVDTDGDGDDDEDDLDTDGDGITDEVEGIVDPDGDGVPAFRDDDSDGDGVLDVDDGVEDPDGDGLPAFLDADADGDGLADGVEGSGDFDRDGTPNHLDRDSDGDGIDDSIEGADDLDCDGRLDRYDTATDDGFCDTALPRGDVDEAPFDGLREPAAPVESAAFEGLGGCDNTGGGLLGMAWIWALFARRRR